MNTTRRTVLGSVAALPALAVASLPAAAVPAPDPRWANLIAAYQRAVIVVAVIGDEQEKAWRDWRQARDLLGEQPVAPELTYPRPIEEMTIRELKALEYAPGARERYKADLASWEGRVAAAKRDTLSNVSERWDAAVDAQNAAAQAIFAYPAPDAASLLRKLDIAEKEYRNCDLDEHVAGHVMADVRRLLGRETRA